MRKIFLAVIFGIFLSSIALFADTSTPVTDVKNQICPVSHEKVSGQNFVTYEGKRYSLCCPLCEKKFKKDPKKYLDSLKK